MKEFDDEMIDIKEDRKWATKAFLTVGAIVIAIVAKGSGTTAYWIFPEISWAAIWAVGIEKSIVRPFVSPFQVIPFSLKR